jgi:large subunit ribosomal protein L31
MTQHPELHLVDATCATCGTTFIVRTAGSSLSIDVCSNCHPAYTGEQRHTAHGDRIDRFNRRRELALT